MGAVTVRNAADDVILPDRAVMPDVPCPIPFAVAPFIVATERLDDIHVALAEKSCVDPSLIVPEATKSWLRPLGTEGEPGVTARLTKTGAVTVRFAAGEAMSPDLAVIFAEP
jgi:hypothetical protein